MNNPLENVLEKVGRVLSDRYGIRVICRGNRCCTDGKTIYLPSLPDEVPANLMGAIRAFLDHEVGHIVGKSDHDIARSFHEKHGEGAFGVLNVLEDLRVERVMRELYAGCGINLRAGYEYAVERLRKVAKDLTPLRQITTGMYSRGSKREDISFLSPEAYAVCDQVADEIQASVTAKNTAEVEELAERAWEVIKSHIHEVPQTPQEGQQEQEPDPKGEESAGDNSRGSSEQAGDDESSQVSPVGGPSQQETPSENKSPKDACSQAQTASSGTQPAREASSQERGHSNGPANVSTAKAGSHGPMGDLSELIEQGVADYSKATRAYRVWTTDHDRIHVAPSAAGRDHQAILAEVMPYVGGVRQRLLQSLQAERNCRWFGDQESGKVDPKSLHRLAMNTSPRVFRIKMKSRTKSTAVTLLVDLSHSMRGQKIQLASQTALIFCEALDKLGIPSSVIGFSTQNSNLSQRVAEATGVSEADLVRQYRFVPLVHTIFKRFEEPWRKVSGRFAAMTQQHLTPLGESLLFAARGIVSRSEERKIVMCLTDGKPVAGVEPEDITFQHAKGSIVRIEKAGIEVILIGIKEPSVSRLHHKHVVVNSLQQLPSTVIRQLQTLLIKGVQRERS